MTQLQVARCARCRAEIVHVQTRRGGHWLWIDADPSPRGTIMLDENNLAIVVSANGFGSRHRPHRATCTINRPVP